jgi:hypothetical protein
VLTGATACADDNRRPYRKNGMILRCFKAGAALACLALCGQPAQADKIKNPTAVFSGLDKITGRIIAFEVAVDETVQFGALQMTPRVCYTRPPTESPQTTTFVEVDEVTLENKYRRIFTAGCSRRAPGCTASSTRSTTSGSPTAKAARGDRRAQGAGRHAGRGDPEERRRREREPGSGRGTQQAGPPPSGEPAPSRAAARRRRPRRAACRCSPQQQPSRRFFPPTRRKPASPSPFDRRATATGSAAVVPG